MLNEKQEPKCLCHFNIFQDSTLSDLGFTWKTAMLDSRIWKVAVSGIDSSLNANMDPQWS